MIRRQKIVRVVELALAEIRPRLRHRRGATRSQILVKHTRGQREAVDGLPRQGAAKCSHLGRVDVLSAQSAAVVVDPVDPAAIAAVECARAKAELAFDNRAARREAAFVSGFAALRVCDLASAVSAVVVQVGLRRNEAYRSALRSGAVQRALRTSQHFDALEIEHCGKTCRRCRAELTNVNRRVVDINAGRRRTRGR